jgi:chaperonin GroEL (HSP60 family)
MLAIVNIHTASHTTSQVISQLLLLPNYFSVHRVNTIALYTHSVTTGARIVTTLADMDGNESFDTSVLGSADEVCEDRVGDGELIFVKGTKTQASCTIVLRGANEYMLDEMDRYVRTSIFTLLHFILFATIGCLQLVSW